MIPRPAEQVTSQRRCAPGPRPSSLRKAGSDLLSEGSDHLHRLERPGRDQHRTHLVCSLVMELLPGMGIGSQGEVRVRVAPEYPRSAMGARPGHREGWLPCDGGRTDGWLLAGRLSRALP